MTHLTMIFVANSQLVARIIAASEGLPGDSRTTCQLSISMYIIEIQNSDTRNMDLPNRSFVPIAAVIISNYPDRVSAWHNNEPGAWGFLAGKAILHAQETLGRRLSDMERRNVWRTMWDALVSSQEVRKYSDEK